MVKLPLEKTRNVYKQKRFDPKMRQKIFPHLDSAAHSPTPMSLGLLGLSDVSETVLDLELDCLQAIAKSFARN